MTRRWAGWIAGAAALLAALSGAAHAQQTFRAATDVVSLTVTVTDNQNRFVPKLPREDFQVFEDGALQDISFFSNDKQPAALSLLVDTSASMENKLGIAEEAATGFVKRLQSDDLAQVVTFDSRVNIAQPFTADRALLEHAIGGITTGGSTSLYNAIYVAIAELKKVRAASATEIRRQAIIVLSDGEDTSSVMDYDQVLDQAKRSEVIIYAIGLRSKDDVPTHGFNEADFVLRTLSQETGGRVFFVNEIKQLPDIYQQIAEELATQYTIGYSSKNPKHDGAWRAVVVRVTAPEMTARTKPGYYAPSVH